MRRPIKAHLVNRSNWPVYRSKPVTHAILNLDLNSNRSNWPVNRSNQPVYRSKPITHAILNLDLYSTGFRSNRSGKPIPEGGGLTGPVGIINPGSDCRPGPAHHCVANIYIFTRFMLVH